MAEYEVFIKRIHNGSSALISKIVEAENHEVAEQKALDICLDSDTMGDDYELNSVVERLTAKFYYNDDCERRLNFKGDSK